MNNARRNRSFLTDEDGSAATTAGFVIAGGLTFILLAVVLFTDVPIIGPNEGEMAPNLEGQIHTLGAESWTNFELYDEVDGTWDAESNPEAKWFLIQFMDTDCPHCWNEAGPMSDIESNFGDRLTMISVAVSLNIPSHDSDREEVVAFQEKASLMGCNSGNSDCSTRSGEPHDWAYFDDLDVTIMDTWGVQGTPFIVIIKPDGEVAWNQGQNQGQEIMEALVEMLPVVEAA